MKSVEEAKKDLEDFLEEHPHLREFQKEIDRRLKKAVTPENRRGVLTFMIEERKAALSQALNVLSYQLNELRETAQRAADSVEEGE